MPGSCENVVVANCVIAANCNAMKWGSETNGGFRNFTITNCVFRRADEPTIYDRPHRTLGGLAIETVDGALLENFNISNISMYGVMTPIFIRPGQPWTQLLRRRPLATGGYPAQHTHRQSLRHHASGWLQAPSPVLTAHPVENVTLSNVHLICDGGGSAEHALNRQPARTGKRVSRDTYLCRRSRLGPLHQNARGLRIQNLCLEVRQADPRSLLFIEQVDDAILDGVTLINPSGTPQLTLRNDNDILVEKLRETPGTTPAGIVVEGNNSRIAIEKECPVKFADNATKKCLLK